MPLSGLVILGTILVLVVNIGYLIGRWNWRIYHKQPVTPRWVETLLWPVSTSDPFYFTPIIIEDLSEGAYEICMAFFWWLKLIYLLIIYCYWIVWTVLKLIGICGVKLATWPLRRVAGLNGVSEISYRKILPWFLQKEE